MKRINVNLTNENHAKIVGYQKRKKFHNLEDALNSFIADARFIPYEQKKKAGRARPTLPEGVIPGRWEARDVYPADG